VVVLDTHVWLWWAGRLAGLSAAAEDAIERAGEVGIAAISCWEMAMLAVKGRIALEPDIEGWIRRALALPGVVALPTTPRIATRAGLLAPGEFPGDPADRLIYATAVDAGAALVTKDEGLRSFDPRKTIW
jgi:PIN domain nuclease of toxin-antitoxin system